MPVKRKETQTKKESLPDGVLTVISPSVLRRPIVFPADFLSKSAGRNVPSAILGG